MAASVMELKIQQAKAPFRSATVLVVLEPRDVAPLWAFARLRGRRDLFIFRGVLQKSPRTELEAHDPTSWSARGIVHRLKAERWAEVSLPSPLVAYARSQSPAAAELVDAAALDACPLVRLAVRRAEPHLEVHWRLDPLRRYGAERVFAMLRQLAQRV